MKIEIRNRTVYVNNQAIPLIGGEVHYWRLHPSEWEKILDSVKELGLEIISTYVPWDFHETGPRQYDFLGETDERRNLKAYLELLEKKGFWILLRPGPYIYSEWKNLGVPDRVIQHHRTHPEFVQESRHYLKSLFETVKPHLASRGGRIILVQPDNELDPFLYTYEDQLGLWPQKGSDKNLAPFQDFLKKKYQNLSSLNRSWGTHFKNFNEARPTCDFLHLDSFLWKRFLDFKEFIYYWVEKMGQLWHDEYRQIGFDVPLYLNLYGFHEIQPWKALAQCADFSALDLYPSQEFKSSGDEHRDFLEKTRALRVASKVPFIAEFQSGTWHGYHETSGLLSPNHYRLSAVSAWLGGITGWSWYMLVNRDNWYLCPIDERGQMREEICSVFRDLIRVFNVIKPHALEKKTKIGVSFFPLHFTTRSIAHNDPLLKSLYEADIDYDFVDFENQPSSKFVFYAGASWLPRSLQQKMLQYVEEGGTFISFLQHPCQDENLKPLNLLKFQEPSAILGEREGLGCIKNLELLLGKEKFPVQSPFYVYEKVQGEPIYAAAPESKSFVGQWNLLQGRQYSVGYRQRKGKGALIHLGVSPTPALLKGLLKNLKMIPFCQSDTPLIQTAAYESPQEDFVFVTHSGKENKSVHLIFHSKKMSCADAQDLFSGEKFPLYSEGPQMSLHFPIARKSGTVLRLV
ncbi:MAG: beta-galactosidase [Chlamydiae bacterium]|nr:beta-galactosidase [Chlamydiota bacterium]MBI3265466.1 beta-galactosidase [Chlamydiota bacterium]